MHRLGSRVLPTPAYGVGAPLSHDRPGHLAGFHCLLLFVLPRVVVCLVVFQESHRDEPNDAASKDVEADHVRVLGRERRRDRHPQQLELPGP